ncbi:hypothetical protein HDU80_002653 [Chytriomyces hyalinus]|nr:hypothetical protein HDU80_002653 [Chytriomyces hyalinus]
MIGGTIGAIAGLVGVIAILYCIRAKKEKYSNEGAAVPHAQAPLQDQEVFLVSHNNKSAGDGGSDAPRGVAIDGGKNENGWLIGSNTRVQADTLATVVDDQAKQGVLHAAASGSSSKPTQGMSSAGIFGVDSERRFEREGPATIEYAKEKDNMHSSHTYVEVQDSFPNLPPSGISRDHGPASRTPPSSDTSITAAEVTRELPPPPYTMF